MNLLPQFKIKFRGFFRHHLSIFGGVQEEKWHFLRKSNEGIVEVEGEGGRKAWKLAYLVRKVLECVFYPS